MIPASLGQLQEKSAVFIARHFRAFNQLVEFLKKYVLNLSGLFLLLLFPLLLILVFVVVRALVFRSLQGWFASFRIIFIRITIK